MYQCSLRSPTWHLDGLQSGEDIFIDPRSAILETVIHELIHRRCPRLGERAVAKRARQLLAGMDEATKCRWWVSFRRIVKIRRPIELDD